MARVEIYTKSFCPFCIKAKRLLDSKDVGYTEIDVSNDPKAQDKMRDRANGRRTVPQIFIDNKGIGGCDELHDLEAQGKLDALLQA